MINGEHYTRVGGKLLGPTPAKLLGPTPTKENHVLIDRKLYTSHPVMLGKEGND